MASSARIDELRKKFEENPRRYFAPLANEYRKAGDVDQAITICREYLPQQPGHMSGHIVYGQALYEARQFEEAKTVFETALSLDPENLIALRHLGDIALIIGDTEGARTWYGRVLEADPRNEEIQAQLKALDSGSMTPTPAIGSPAVPASEEVRPEPARAEAEQVRSTSSSPTTVVMPAMPRFAVERTVEQPALTAFPRQPSLSDAPTTEITLDTVPVPAVPEVEKLASPAAPDAVPAASVSAEPPVPSAADRAIAGMTEGFEATAAAPSSTPVDPTGEAPVLEGLETTSISPAPGLPTEETGAAPPPKPPVAAASEAAPGAASADEERSAPASPVPLMDLEITVPEGQEAATRAEAAAMRPDEAISSQRDATPEAESSAPSVDLPLIDVSEPARDASSTSSVPAPSAAAASEETEVHPPLAESGPFVTETMAELYLQQGHREEALRVYKALLEQRPFDAGLQRKTDELLAASGPTIRDLLKLIATRRPGARPEQSQPAEAMAQASAPPVAVPESAPQNGAAAPRERESVTFGPDLLSPLFSGAAVAPGHEAAARILADAFSNGSGGSDARSLAGSPARRAAKDLSLDAVFGTAENASAQPSSFSFDQFFSQRATAEHPTPTSGAGSGGQESREDVAKFTQWLEGLKQR